MKIWIENRVYALHSTLIILMRKLRHAFGWLNSKTHRNNNGLWVCKNPPMANQTIQMRNTKRFLYRYWHI